MLALIFTFASFVAAAVLLGLSCVFRSRDLGRLCTEHVKGRVVGASPIAYFDHHIPRCEFEAEGRTWHVSGPKFANSVVGSGVKSNLTTREELPDVLRAPMLIVDRPGANLENFVVTNEVLYEASPISKLYPIGSEVDVRYAPGNPKLAYVQRPVDSTKLPRTILRVLGICFLFVGGLLALLSALGVFPAS